MQQIKLITQTTGSFKIGMLEEEANKWLKENSDKEIVDIAIIYYPSEPQHGDLGLMGWIIMIRYKELDEASVS